MQEMEKHSQLLTHYLCLCVKQVLREMAETEMLDISGKISKDYHRYAKMVCKASDEVMTSRGRHHKLHYPDILVNTFLKGLRSQALISSVFQGSMFLL